MPNRRELANAIRALSMDAVERANSGHPGMPMGMADIAEVLWNDFLNHNPENPAWINRDRFILSNGHGSMLQYSLLHLSGYDVTMEDIKNFRQLHSKTPGHPEVGDTPGIETTTGPLGQGLANAVGMAVARDILAAKFNRDGFNIIDHYIYTFVGDGCLMEGISHEVCSLAGTLKLNKLIVFWDDNHISIDGDIDGWFRDDTPKRFEAYGWHVIRDIDGQNGDRVKQAIEQAQTITDKPVLICCRTIIGFGSPHKAGKESSHGSPLGEDEVAESKKALNWPYAAFEIPADYYEAFDARAKGKTQETAWQEKFNDYQTKYPELAREFTRRIKSELPLNWSETMKTFIANLQQNPGKIATRKASQKVLETLGPMLPELLGGSADLSGSNLTNWSGSVAFSDAQHDANYIHYGVREFGMSAMMNGMALYGGFIPYGGTFLVFYSYAASAIRMAALMKQRVIFIYSHDSIGLGEDGPTHQPIEQIAALRAIPNLSTWRPSDTVETAVAWQYAIENQSGPTALLLSRQSLSPETRDINQLDQIKCGGYVLKDCNGTPNGIMMATGSEIGLAMEAAKILDEQGQRIRVVSMPSQDVFAKQTEAYRDSVLPKTVTARVAIEAGSRLGWHRWVGDKGTVIGLDEFGRSAPMQAVFADMGLTGKNIVETMKTVLIGGNNDN